MDLALLVYGISVLGKLGVVIGIVTAIGIIIGILAAIVRIFHTQESWDSERENQVKQGRRDTSFKIFKYCVIIVSIAMLLKVLLPSEKTAYIMVGAYAAQKVVENDKVQAMSGKVMTIIEQKLDSYIEDGIKEAEKVNAKTKPR